MRSFTSQLPFQPRLWHVTHTAVACIASHSEGQSPGSYDFQNYRKLFIFYLRCALSRECQPSECSRYSLLRLKSDIRRAEEKINEEKFSIVIVAESVQVLSETIPPCCPSIQAGMFLMNLFVHLFLSRPCLSFLRSSGISRALKTLYLTA